MAVRVGGTLDQQLTASDANEDPLTFSMVSGPAYITVTTVDAQAGIGNIHLAPGSGDVGGAIVVIQVTDGALTDQKSFSIAVLDIAPAGGGVIYSNFGSAMTFDTDRFHGWGINGFFNENTGQQGIAHRFTPGVTDLFQSAEIALVAFSGPPTVHVYLQLDSNGIPGPVLEQINVTGLTSVPTIFEATSVLHPLLQSGTPYWLTVVAGADRVLAGWQWNSTGDHSTGTNFAGTQGGNPAGPWGLDTFGSIRSVFQINGTPLSALLDLVPSAINTNNHSSNETGYIQLPIGFSPSEIDIATVRLAGVPALSKPAVIGDHNRDGVPDLMVKFSRDLLDPHLTPGMNRLEVTGTLVDGHKFEGTDSVKVVPPPHHPLSASVAPNPLNPVGTLTFHTARAGTVSIKLFDIRGRLVRRLLEAQSLGEGSHEVLIDGRGEAGRPLASGMYFYRVEAPDGDVTGRFAVLK
jgi:hypothetical protein